MMSDQLPSYQSERMFKKYEKPIQKIVKDFPNRSTFDPAPYSPNTYACRLRDSMTSLMKHRWNTAIDINRLEEIRPQVKVCIAEGKVVVCLNHEKPISAIDPTDAADGPAIDVVEPEEVHIHAVCILLNDKKVAGPFRLLKVKVDEIRPLLERHQVGFYVEGDTVIVL